MDGIKRKGKILMGSSDLSLVIYEQKILHETQSKVLPCQNKGFMPNQYRSTQFLKDPSLYDVRYTGSNVIGQYSKLPDSNISEEELLEAQQRRSDEDEKTTKS